MAQALWAAEVATGKGKGTCCALRRAPRSSPRSSSLSSSSGKLWAPARAAQPRLLPSPPPARERPGGCLPLSPRWRSTRQHLRHVEKDVLIPKIMREKARERCSEQVEVDHKNWVRLPAT
ncbi:COX assembly mitochondrial protein homolog isoform X3 [Rhinolophus sinicus]|uniref:COX assembly mitochondrial protein homolog isoform X3 n=1 Tax=Rhinolophus sinicus TaxID=89399 RepID=UPI003D7A16DB